MSGVSQVIIILSVQRACKFIMLMIDEEKIFLNSHCQNQKVTSQQITTVRMYLQYFNVCGLSPLPPLPLSQIGFIATGEQD